MDGVRSLPRKARWATWALGAVIVADVVALGVVSDAENIRWTAILDLVAGGLDIVAAVLAILVVRRMTTRQLDRARVLEALGEAAPGDVVAAPSPA